MGRAKLRLGFRSGGELRSDFATLLGDFRGSLLLRFLLGYLRLSELTTLAKKGDETLPPLVFPGSLQRPVVFPGALNLGR